MIIFRFDAIGPNKKIPPRFLLKKTLKKSVKPTKNPALFFSFEKCTVK